MGRSTIFSCVPDHALALSQTLKKSKEIQLNQTNLFGLIQQILHQQEGGGEAEEQVVDGPVCSNCHLSYEQYRKTLLLGCSECYNSFEELLIKDLRKFHGAVSQEGEAIPMAEEAAAKLSPTTTKAPPKKSPVTTVTMKENLSRQLAEAIKEENFERAAALRDAIRKLEQPPKTENTEK